MSKIANTLFVCSLFMIGCLQEPSTQPSSGEVAGDERPASSDEDGVAVQARTTDPAPSIEEDCLSNCRNRRDVELNFCSRFPPIDRQECNGEAWAEWSRCVQICL